MIKIRKIEYSEILQLRGFPPEDWEIDLPGLITFHFDQPYFYPVIAETDNKIVGCGNGFVHGRIGWLGQIIVIPEYRRQGIGYAITSHLVEFLKSNGCSTLFLIATDLGEPVYRKLGFIRSSVYTVYKRENPIPIRHVSNVREIRREDIIQIKELDSEISGEERFHLIQRYLSTGLVYFPSMSDRIKGFYLPDFGGGLILATESDAGFELIKARLNLGKTNAIIPSTNLKAKFFLESEGFQETKSVPRMVLGKDINWNPSMIYNRGTGYSG